MNGCRSCGAASPQKFLELGPSPLANRFLRADELLAPEPRYPLDVYFCDHCGLVQLLDVVPPEILFRQYIYVSSTSDTAPRHFADLASEVAGRCQEANPLIVEVASNDGCLLASLKSRPVRILGVEPAVNLAEVAERAGVPTVNEFFSSSIARTIRATHGPASAIIANNVLAHVDELQDFVEGFRTLLAPHGTIVVEVPYLIDLLSKQEYDTIYHEHLSYFSLGTLVGLFERHELEITEVRRVSIHGGSLRVYARHAAPASTAADRRETLLPLLELERRTAVDRVETFRQFAAAVQGNRQKLLALLADLKRANRRIAAYGAPAKGNTLLNYCRIGTDTIEYAVDKNPLKQGLYTPGMHIPVQAPGQLLLDQPDAALLLAWNFADEILQQQVDYRRRGGRFIVPIPEPAVI